MQPVWKVHPRCQGKRSSQTGSLFREVQYGLIPVKNVVDLIGQVVRYASLELILELILNSQTCFNDCILLHVYLLSYEKKFASPEGSHLKQD